LAGCVVSLWCGDAVLSTSPLPAAGASAVDAPVALRCCGLDAALGSEVFDVELGDVLVVELVEDSDESGVVEVSAGKAVFAGSFAEGVMNESEAGLAGGFCWS
jgi:hypothetical protein